MLFAPGGEVEVGVCGGVVFVFSVFPDWVLYLFISLWVIEIGGRKRAYVSEIIDSEYSEACIGEGIH